MLHNLSSLLEKFKHIKNPREEKEGIASVISKTLGFVVSPDAVRIVKRVIYLDVSPYVKTEVNMRKEKIITTLRESGYVFDEVR